MTQLTRTTQRGVAQPPTPAGIGALQINSPPLSPEVTLGYLLSYIHRFLTIYNKRTFEPRLIFESFSSFTVRVTFHNMGKYREV